MWVKFRRATEDEALSYVSGTSRVAWVPIAQLIATQATCFKATVQHYAHCLSWEPIDVIQRGDGFLINNGHHRAHAALLKGEQHIFARVHDYSGAEEQK
jgi:hypothetical protein